MNMHYLHQVFAVGVLVGAVLVCLYRCLAPESKVPADGPSSL